MTFTLPPVVVTFRTTSGAFVLPAKHFEDGREGELAYAFATRMPEGAKSAGRQVDKEGNVTVRWRRIEVVKLSAGDGIIS